MTSFPHTDDVSLRHDCHTFKYVLKSDEKSGISILVHKNYTAFLTGPSGILDVNIHNPKLNGELDELGIVGKIEFRHDTGTVTLDGAHA